GAAAPPPGPSGVPRVVVAIGFGALIVLGLAVFGLVVPVWLKEHPESPAWVSDYLAPMGAVALFVVLLVALVGLLRGLRGAESPMPAPYSEPPATSAFPSPVPQNCPRCGQLIPAESPQGLCPRC